MRLNGTGEEGGMSGHFNYIVVGRGMMGAAAARHLA